jgi:hypothetical protein
MRLKTLGVLLVELAIDWVTGKLESKREPERKGLTHAESELQSKYAREAGKHGVVKVRR